MQKLTIAAALLALSLLASGCPGKREPQSQTGRELAQSGVEDRDTAEQLKANVGLPMVLVLPEGAHGEDELDLLPPNMGPGSTSWSTQFHYDKGFEAAVQSFDEQLKPQGFARFIGPALHADTNFDPAGKNKPQTARGKRAWLSEDRKILMLLAYIYKRGENGAADEHAFQLSVLKSEKGSEVKGPNKLQPIE